MNPLAGVLRAVFALVSAAVATSACSDLQPRSVTAGCQNGIIAPQLAPVAPNRSSRSLAEAASPPSKAQANLAGLKECLEVEKLRLETRKLDNDLTAAPRGFEPAEILAFLLKNIAFIAAAIGAIVGFWKYFDEKRKSREEEENKRFESVVASLGSAVPEARIGAAALLGTFLGTGYERFYVPVFKLTVGYLGGRSVSAHSAGSPKQPHDVPIRGSAASAHPSIQGIRERRDVEPLDQMLASVFKTAYPLALVRLVREQTGRRRGLLSRRHHPVKALKVEGRWSADEFIAALERGQSLLLAKQQASKSLSAERVMLDGVYLAAASFPCAWLRGASFAGFDGTGSNFSHASLEEADFGGARLQDADFTSAVLERSTFAGANLEHASFRKMDGREANFARASLARADFQHAILDHADFSGADFSSSELAGEATIEQARSLRGANFANATGLTFDQAERCKAEGALNVPEVTKPISSLASAGSFLDL